MVYHNILVKFTYYYFSYLQNVAIMHTPFIVYPFPIQKKDL